MHNAKHSKINDAQHREAGVGMTGEIPIPDRAAELLRRFLTERDVAEDKLQNAISLVLAAVGAPPDAQIVMARDGSMTIQAPGEEADHVR